MALRALGLLRGLLAQRHRLMTDSAWARRHQHGAAAAVATQPGAPAPRHLVTTCLHRHRVRLMIHGALHTLLVLKMRLLRELGSARLRQLPSMLPHLELTMLLRQARSTHRPLVAGKVDGALTVRLLLVPSPRLRLAPITALPLLVGTALPRHLLPVGPDTRMMTEQARRMNSDDEPRCMPRIDSQAFWILA